MRGVILVVLVAMAACSGARAKPADQAVEPPVKDVPVVEDEAPPDQGEGIPWADKSHDQRKAYMGMTVKPRMATVFGEFDPERFAEVKCGTCHGPDAKARNFEMPNPDLPPMADFEKLKKEKPEMVQFMRENVVPEMAALLGQEPFDPATKTGFGCGACHPH